MLAHALFWGAIATAVVLAFKYSSRKREAKIPASEPPRCGTCGYIILGLPSSICPECGSDLRIVGLRESPRVRRLHKRFVIWFMVWLGGAASLIVLVSEMAIDGTFERYDALFSGPVALPDDPSGSRDWSISMLGEFHCRAFQMSLRTSNADLRFFVRGERGEQHELHVSSASRRWSCGEDAVSRFTSPAAREMLVDRWLRSCGVVPTNKEVRAIAANITELTSAMRQNGQCFHLNVKGVSYSGGESGRLPPSPQLGRAIFPICLLWLAWLPWGIVRHRRRMRQSADKDLRNAGLTDTK